MIENNISSESWKEITDFELWDRNLALLNGHPLQSALWGEARKQVDGYDSLYLMLQDNGVPVWMARVETRKLPILGKVAWIPRGLSVPTGVVSVDIEAAFRLELSKRGFCMSIIDKYEEAVTDSDVHTIWIDLGQELDLLKKRIDKQWMYGVRRAAREGVETVRASSAIEVSEFYRMSLEVSQRKGFELPGSEALMQQLLRSTSALGQEMHLFLAKHEGKIGAGVFVARSGRHAHYFWGASDRALSRQRVGEAVQWAVIEWALAQGCNRYDLEGIDPINNPGVYAFKKKMGGDEVRLRGKFTTPLNWRGAVIQFSGRLTGRI